MLLSAPLSGLSDRIPRVRLIAIGWFAYAGVFGGLGAAADSTVSIAVLLAAYGVVLAVTEGAEKALIADMVPDARLGVAYGWFHLVSGLMLVPASVAFGWLWEKAGVAVAFGASGGVAALAALALLAVTRAPRK
jgi:MFS family permease